MEMFIPYLGGEAQIYIWESECHFPWCQIFVYRVTSMNSYQAVCSSGNQFVINFFHPPPGDLFPQILCKIRQWKNHSKWQILQICLWNYFAFTIREIKATNWSRSTIPKTLLQIAFSTRLFVALSVLITTLKRLNSWAVWRLGDSNYFYH